MTDRHKNSAKTIRLDPQDREAIAHIREVYGCTSDNAAIKLAVRMLAAQDTPIMPKHQTR